MLAGMPDRVGDGHVQEVLHWTLNIRVNMDSGLDGRPARSDEPTDSFYQCMSCFGGTDPIPSFISISAECCI